MVRPVFYAAASIALLAGFKVHAQDAAPNAAAENLVKMHEAWGPKASSPNASLVIKESVRSGQTIKFRLIASGAPKDAVYSLFGWAITQRGPVELLKGVTLDASGLAVCAGAPGTCGSADSPNDPIDLPLNPVPGEPFRFGLVSADGAVKVFAKIVPVPLRGEDQGCTVEATLLIPGAELVLIVGSGFPPNSNINMEANSEGERHGGPGKTDADGRYVSAIEPHKQGVSAGSATVNLKAAKCAPSVKVPWGRRK